MAPNNWSATDLVRQHIESAAQHIAAVQVDFNMRWLSSSSMESPMEAIFWVWWGALATSGEIDTENVGLYQQQDAHTKSGRTYRLDFALRPHPHIEERAAKVGLEIAKIAIEIDGHDFHERTKEQVAYRNQRDRDLLADGWKVLHFSGSEVNRKPQECVEQAFDVAYTAFGGFCFERELIEREAAVEAVEVGV